MSKFMCDYCGSEIHNSYIKFNGGIFCDDFCVLNNIQSSFDYKEVKIKEDEEWNGLKNTYIYYNLCLGLYEIVKIETK